MLTQMDHENDDESPTSQGRGYRPARLRVSLRSMDEVARELARLYREMKSGTIPTQDGSRLANVLQILARIMEGGDLERRIAALEEADRKRLMP